MRLALSLCSMARDGTVAIVVTGLLLSCNVLTPGGGSSSDSRLLSAALGPDGQPTREAVGHAEEDIWAALRTPLREELGEDADLAFQQLDELRQSLLTKVLQDLDIPREGSKPPGLAQFEALAFVTVGLSEIPRSYASREDGTATKTEHVSSGPANGEMKLTVTKSASRIAAEVEMRITITAENGAVVNETAQGKMEIQLCPDAEGRAPVDLSLTMNSEGSRGGKSAGIQFTLAGSTDALVNDNADFTGYTADITSSLGSQSPAGEDPNNQFAEVHTEFSAGNMQGEGDPRISGYNSQTTRASSGATEPTADAARRLGQSMAALFMAFVSNKAEEIWQNGYCVEIIIEGAADHNTIPASATKSFRARVHHRFEGLDLEVPVRASLSGDQAIAPVEKTDAPVSYVYTAPREEGKTATANLETRSRRGAATTNVQFYTLQGWKIDQEVTLGEATFQITGLSCNGAYGEWKITYETYNAEADFEITGVLTGLFQPDGTGKLSHTVKAVFFGRPMGATAAGEVAATIRPDGDNYIIELNQGWVDVSAYVENFSGQSSGTSSGRAELNVVPADEADCGGQ